MGAFAVRARQFRGERAVLKRRALPPFAGGGALSSGSGLRGGQFLRRAAEATPLELEPDADPREAEGWDRGPGLDDRETPEPDEGRAEPEDGLETEPRIDEFWPEEEDRIDSDREDEPDRGGEAFDLVAGALRDGSVTRLRIEALPPDRVWGADERTAPSLRGTAFELPEERMP